LRSWKGWKRGRSDLLIVVFHLPWGVAPKNGSWYKIQTGCIGVVPWGQGEGGNMRSWEGVMESFGGYFLLLGSMCVIYPKSWEWKILGGRVQINVYILRYAILAQGMVLGERVSIYCMCACVGMLLRCQFCRGWEDGFGQLILENVGLKRDFFYVKYFCAVLLHESFGWCQLLQVLQE
jgi:hypothetical protein